MTRRSKWQEDTNDNKTQTTRTPKWQNKPKWQKFPNYKKTQMTRRLKWKKRPKFQEDTSDKKTNVTTGVSGRKASWHSGNWWTYVYFTEDLETLFSQQPGRQRQKHHQLKYPSIRTTYLSWKKAILEGYKRTESSVYSELKNSSFWSFMHDRINKFSSQLNGIYIRYLYAENNPCSSPYASTKVRQGFKWICVGILSNW